MDCSGVCYVGLFLQGMHSCLCLYVDGTKATPCWTKLFELDGSDDHTLFSNYRKQISSSCLDEKYKEVKSVKKMGFCYNVSCSLPGRKVERSKMFRCTRFLHANYRSVECKKADWKRHKKCCDEMKANSVFHAKKS